MVDKREQQVMVEKREHQVTVRLSEIDWIALSAKENEDGIAPATRLAMVGEEIAEKFRHASNIFQRALDAKQAADSASKP